LYNAYDSASHVCCTHMLISLLVYKMHYRMEE